MSVKPHRQRYPRTFLCMSTRLVYYNEIGETSRGARHVSRTRAFIRKAATELRRGNSFFGIVFAPTWTFQARLRKTLYYAELLNTRTLDVDYIHCRLPTLLRLIDTAWQAHDRRSFLRHAPLLKWRRKNVRAETRKPAEPSTPKNHMSAPPTPSTLGHGDHWKALLPGWGDRLAEFIPWLTEAPDSVSKFSAPWPAPGYAGILRLTRDTGPHVELTALIGLLPNNKSLRFLSCYPTLRETRVWPLLVGRLSDSYGPFEGVVEFTLANGASLRAFDPRFGENRNHWRAGATQPVALAALALRVSPYDAAPIRITEGPLIEEERQRLHAEGRPDEAAALDHLTIYTDQLRTLYSGENHDHSAFVGRVDQVREIPARDPLPAGWLLDVELMPDEGQPPPERTMPVYAYPSALGAYRPQADDLIEGTLWVQAAPT